MTTKEPGGTPKGPVEQLLGGDGLLGDESSRNIEDVAANLAAYWLLYLVRGLVVTSISIFFLIEPTASMGVLTLVFGILFILEAIGNLLKVCIVCCGTDSQYAFCLYLLAFATNTSIGVTVLVYPDETLQLLIWFVALAFLSIGVMQMLLGCLFAIAYVEPDVSFMIFLVGFFYTILAGGLMSHLNEGVEFVIRMIGVVTLMFGVQLLYLGFRLKSMNIVTETEDGHDENPTIFIEELSDDNEETVQLTSQTV